jgi:hypothetical protein
MLAERAGEIRALREQLCGEWAAHHGTAPEAVSLRLLAQHGTDETREWLLQSRARLRELAGEVRDLNRGNVRLASHCHQFLQQVLQDFTGAARGSPCYGPTGTPRVPVCGALIEVRG